MPQREQFFADMTGENRQAALLVAQVGAAPNELQVITQIAEYDEEAEGLRPIRTYIVRVLGVLEHRINNFGMTVADVNLHDAHPLLYEYLERPTAVFFKGEVENVDSLTLDIAQAHASTFGPWRQFPQYLNTQQPLQTLFESGGGLIGQMPEPLAERVVKVLAHHQLEHRLAHGEPYIKQHDNPLLVNNKPQVLTFGTSYFVSYAFAFDEMKGRAKPQA